MSFEPVKIHYGGKREPVHLSIRRGMTKGGRPRICLSLSVEVLKAAGLVVGDKVTPMVGSGADNGILRLAVADQVGAGVFVRAVKTGNGAVTRGNVAIRPWMDLRGVPAISSLPCRCKVGPGEFIDIELPSELVSLPALKVVG